MSDINVNDLATLSPSALDGDYYGIVFTPNGDTNKVVFEDAVAQANSNNGCVCIEEAYLAISSADMLQIATFPQIIIPAQGAGTAIDVLSVVCKYNHGGTDYSSGGNILIYDLSGPQFYMNGTLQATGSRFVKGIPSTPTGADSNLTENSPIYIATLVDPINGDGDFEFWVNYRVITV